jgi:hypothetical protein
VLLVELAAVLVEGAAGGTALPGRPLILRNQRRETMTDKQKDVRPNSREEAGDERASDAQDHVLHPDEKRDESLKDSMDASDPPSTAKPGDKGDPVPSSGFSAGEDR